MHEVIIGGVGGDCVEDSERKTQTLSLFHYEIPGESYALSFLLMICKSAIVQKKEKKTSKSF